LLKQTSSEAEKSSEGLLFKGSLLDLGDYREAVHNHDVNHENNQLYFRFTVPNTVRTLKSVLNSIELDDDANISRHTERLFRSVSSYKTMGMALTFQNTGTVGKLEFFLGDEHKPLLTYTADSKATFFKTKRLTIRLVPRFRELRLSSINTDHSYFRLPEETKLLAEKTKRFRGTPLSELKASQRKRIRKLLEIVLDRFHPTVYTHMPPAVRELWPDDFIGSYSDVKKYLFDFRRGKEETERERKAEEALLGPINENLSHGLARFKDDRISIEGLLPVLLNGKNFEKMVRTERDINADDWSDKDADNSALFLFHVANKLSKFIRSIHHIGPLRNYPERYHTTYSPISTSYVGARGEYVLDVLANHKRREDKVNEKLHRLKLGYEIKLINPEHKETDLRNLHALRLKKPGEVYVSIADVGFGVSQVLPIVVQSVCSQQKTILIEQPEVHLHPAQQAALGDVFIESVRENDNTFLIETHSEHLILRLLRRIRETSEGKWKEGSLGLTPEEVSVVYVQPTENGSKVIELKVTEDGDFSDIWPDGFFTERAEELF
jgi:hypothetical protein